MHRFITLRRILISSVALLCLLAATLGVTIFANRASAHINAYVALSDSFTAAPAGAHLTGAHANNQSLTITLVLKSNKANQMNTLLSELYDPHSRMYHHWLKQGQFNAMFAPDTSQIAAVNNFLTKAGLKLASSPSPFLVRASGTTAQVESALHTQVNNYVAANGRSFFQNDTPLSIPASLSNDVIAISGLSDLSNQQTNYVTTRAAAKKAGKATPQYGAGPGGSGLTPSQTESLYDATPVYQLGNRGKGQGATLGLFELSGYTPADITAYEQQFFGKSVRVKLVDINVDGGPVTPVCPTGDECGPFDSGPCANGCDSADFTGDIEVEADIENQLSVAPKASRILVYNAPNDELGITVVNEYFKIASDDLADSISSSWGECEKDEGIGTAEAESVAFMQMAFQGQSMFSAAGDTGAFDCLRGSGFTGLTVDDPSSQPFVTAVGGTSFGSFDPGSNLHPLYPIGFETVWNVLDLCNGTPSGLANCANFGAGGGGVSTFWSKPPYQYGAGVLSKFSQKSPYCTLARSGQFCRELPDVSANADEFTPYAEFCTGDPNTNSTCATFSGAQTPPGWFGIGGTSLSSPLWSAVIALWDSVHGQRFGNANFGLYQLFRANHSYTRFFHDITGVNQTENSNGFYPVTRNYDMATGIGTPRIAGLVLD